MGKVKIGIVGCGGISHAHIGPYQKNRYSEVTAVADIDAAKAKAVGNQYGVKWYADPDKMFDQEPLDAISICTPPASHRDVALKAARRKIHIFCEKPLAAASAQAKEMIKVAEENKVLLTVAYCHLFHEPLVRLEGIIRQGKIGKVVSYRNRFHWGGGSDAEVRMRGGILLDNGIHSLSIFHYLVGEVGGATAVFNKNTKDLFSLRQCYLMLEAQNGALGIVELEGRSPGLTPSSFIVEVFGEKGAGVIDYSGQSFYINEKGKRKIVLDPKSGYADRFVKEINYFVNCVRGIADPAIIAAEKGLKDLQIVETAFKAGREGKLGKLP